MKRHKMYSPNPLQEVEFFENIDLRKKLCPQDKALEGIKPVLSDTEVLIAISKSNIGEKKFDDLYVPFDFCYSK